VLAAALHDAARVLSQRAGGTVYPFGAHRGGELVTLPVAGSRRTAADDVPAGAARRRARPAPPVAARGASR
jgi:hypothetical protein